ncbi:LPXTG cell wall anchor domain-containing protein (plasmid) [Enterococcus gilvus]|jgi:LPXTG-motif cell wall-anchored protein|nr:LPXTG cell wall anchor domain-containing protein [Enterococcus gilvus]
MQMNDTIKVTGTLNMPVESSVPEPEAASPSSKPKEVIHATTRNEYYPQTGERMENEFLILGILLILLAIVIYMRQQLKSEAQ